MRIAIDLRLFDLKEGGLARYNQEFLKEFIKLNTDHKYILIFRQKPDIDLPANFEIRICNCRPYSLKEQFILPILLYKLKVDLVHFTHFNVPLFYGGNFIVTIHDLIMKKFPSQRASTLNKNTFKIKYYFYEQVIRQAVKNSKKIIAVSKFTAQDIKKQFVLSEIESQKIEVVYEGLSQMSSSQNEAFNLPDNYFLYVGNAYPHKNLDFLLKTFDRFLKRHPEYHLILVGNKNYFYERLAKENKVANVVFAGYVSDDKLPSYYKNAKAYIFPSLYEGFGLPPLEAMQFSLPVLSANSSCLPEILGHSALYFDPKDQDDLLFKMEEIIKNQELRNTLIRNATLQLKKYSWQKMAKDILEIYEKSVIIYPDAEDKN